MGALQAELQEALVDQGDLFDQGHQAGVSPVRLEVGAVCRVDDGPGVVGLGARLEARMERLLVDFGYHGGEGVFLGLEVRIEGARGDAGF